MGKFDIREGRLLKVRRFVLRGASLAMVAVLLATASAGAVVTSSPDQAGRRW
jgi:hypothetical protein